MIINKQYSKLEVWYYKAPNASYTYRSYAIVPLRYTIAYERAAASPMLCTNPSGFVPVYCLNRRPVMGKNKIEQHD